MSWLEIDLKKKAKFPLNKMHIKVYHEHQLKIEEKVTSAECKLPQLKA